MEYINTALLGYIAMQLFYMNYKITHKVEKKSKKK